MERRVLQGDELTTAVAALDGWQVDDKVLRKTWTFINFAEALALVNRVGELAEAADHHPDIEFGWGYVRLALTTHDRGGITDVDIALAKRIDSLTIRE